MNRSYSKIRHIQEANKKLEERRLSLLTEQVDILSGYTGSGTDVDEVGIEDSYDMSGIKVTRDEGEIKRKGMSPNDPIYKKIEDFFVESGRFHKGGHFTKNIPSTKPIDPAWPSTTQQTDLPTGPRRKNTVLCTNPCCCTI